MKTDSETPSTRKLNVSIPEEDHRRLKAAAALNGQQLSAYLSALLSRTARTTVLDSSVPELAEVGQ